MPNANFFQNAIFILGAAFLYAVSHSFLASHTLKGTLGKYLGRWYRLFFNAVAGITLLPVLALVPFLPDKVLYSVSPPWQFLMLGVQLSAIILAALPFIQTDIWHFLGLRQIMEVVPPAHTPFKEVGLYRQVRHPGYFFSLIFLWASPLMTFNQMMLYIAFSLYLWVGAIFEERKLAREFGTIYADYQRRVPMLIPWKISLWRK